MLTELAAQYDLELEQTQTFNQYFPDWPEIPLTEQIAAYSATHRSFCFRKLSKSANAGREPFSAIRSAVRRLWSTQVAAQSVTNDIRLGVYAHDEAYPDDAIVRRLSQYAVVPAPEDDSAAADVEDESSSSSEVAAEVVEEAPPPQQKKQVAAKKRLVKAEDADEQKSVTKKKKVGIAPGSSGAKNQGCSARCSGGDCRGCICRRTHHSKCHSGCQCGPNCQNR